jgi:2,4-dienoyl-CoA reductase-like NADH-dependent reductase (Old Yellow Enzyme family)
MRQYSAEDGAANDWHLQHLGSLSLSGAALVIVEQTAVEPAGRISHGCLGLYSDANERALARVVGFCRRAGSAALGIQLAHAGRKGSAKLPWEGGGPLTPGAGAWTTAAPSAIPFDDHWPAPQALDAASLARIREAHANTARRADRLGFDLAELLAAHGLLLHSFLSPIANRRIDAYGGSLANRIRYPLEVAAVTREAWPHRKPLGMRITGCDWVDGGITTDEAGIFASELRAIGFDYVCVSSGGISPQARPSVAPGYQVPLAATVKKASGIAVQAVGMIVNPHQAEAIIAGDQADFVALARGFLDDPRWGLARSCGAWRRCRLPAAVSSRASRTLAGHRAGTPPTARAIKQRGVAWRHRCARLTSAIAKQLGQPPLDPNVRGVERAPPPRGRAPRLRGNSSERVMLAHAMAVVRASRDWPRCGSGAAGIRV